MDPTLADPSPSAPSTPEREHAAMTKVRNFEDVRFGEYLIKTWCVCPSTSGLAAEREEGITHLTHYLWMRHTSRTVPHFLMRPCPTGGLHRARENEKLRPRIPIRKYLRCRTDQEDRA